MKKMKALIIGGSGFVGPVLKDTLESDLHTVCLSTSSRQTPGYVELNVLKKKQ